MRLALRVADAAGWEDRAGQVVWRDTSVRPPAQVADAVVKLVDAGVPLGIVLEMVAGWTPTEVLPSPDGAGGRRAAGRPDGPDPAG